MVTTNFTRHENETKVFDELLLWIQNNQTFERILSQSYASSGGITKN